MRSTPQRGRPDLHQQSGTASPGVVCSNALEHLARRVLAVAEAPAPTPQTVPGMAEFRTASDNDLLVALADAAPGLKIMIGEWRAAAKLSRRALAAPWQLAQRLVAPGARVSARPTSENADPHVTEPAGGTLIPCLQSSRRPPTPSAPSSTRHGRRGRKPWAAGRGAASRRCLMGQALARPEARFSWPGRDSSRPRRRRCDDTRRKQSPSV